MDTKNLLMLILITSLSFLVIAATGGYVYVSHPELLGIQRTIPESDTTVQQISASDSLELALAALNTERDSLAAVITSQNDSLLHFKTTVEQSKNTVLETAQHLETTKKQIESIKQKHSQENDSLRLKNIQIFAEMYDKADPSGVAKILAKARPQFSAQVLKRMKRKNAAKVLENLSPENANAIAAAGLQ